jgi:hypothetical protein
MGTGTINPDEFFADNELGREMKKAALAYDAEKRSRMSPPGTLRIPRLLDQRRLEYGITDAAFKEQPLFDRVYAYQIDQFEGETFGDTMIIRPDSSKDRDRRSAPRAIIVGAGLAALDALRSNGVDLGHIVSFLRLAPWSKRFDVIGGHEEHLLILRAGDIIGSEDLRAQLESSEVIERVENDQHVYVNRGTGAKLAPQMPEMSEEF